MSRAVNLSRAADHYPAGPLLLFLQLLHTPEIIPFIEQVSSGGKSNVSLECFTPTRVPALFCTTYLLSAESFNFPGLPRSGPVQISDRPHNNTQILFNQEQLLALFQCIIVLACILHHSDATVPFGQKFNGQDTIYVVRVTPESLLKTGLNVYSIIQWGSGVIFGQIWGFFPLSPCSNGDISVEVTRDCTEQASSLKHEFLFWLLLDECANIQ